MRVKTTIALTRRLLLAVQQSHLEAAQLLLERGADANSSGFSGETPLHLASGMEMVVLLLANKGNPARPDRDGTRPIDWALIETNYDIFEVLAAGAPQLGSPAFQLIEYARRHELTVEARRHDEQFVQFRASKIGRSGGQERCLGWQFHGDLDQPTRGWRCYELSQFRHAYLAEPYDR